MFSLIFVAVKTTKIMDQTSFSINHYKLTGFVYDERMVEHKCLWDLKYNEKPERFTCILERYISIFIKFVIICYFYVLNKFYFV